ncbi:hypothetical protein niasHT_009360 [Heterodera trifolii]|uniref:PSI domain-containing protein n=1 Tax=Heterodera trifolii TaxID=157864 RepID=A0ABD2M4Q4_9BILA
MLFVGIFPRHLLDSSDEWALFSGKVLLISLSLCGFSSPTSASCSDCLAGGDPLCSWCLPLGRCTRPQQCPTTDGSLRECPSAFGTPRPENVSLSASTRPRILLSVYAGYPIFRPISPSNARSVPLLRSAHALNSMRTDFGVRWRRKCHG